MSIRSDQRLDPGLTERTGVDNLERYRPAVPDDFCILFELTAGPIDQTGEESFCVLVCSPKWLGRTVSEKQVLIGRHHLIVNGYNYDRIREFLDVYCDKCIGKNWDEAANKSGRIGMWEFEDYQPHAG